MVDKIAAGFNSGLALHKKLDRSMQQIKQINLKFYVTTCPANPFIQLFEILISGIHNKDHQKAHDFNIYSTRQGHGPLIR